MIGTLLGRFLLVLLMYVVGLLIGWLWPWRRETVSAASATDARSGAADASPAHGGGTSTRGVDLARRGGDRRMGARPSHGVRDGDIGDRPATPSDGAPRKVADWRTGTPNGHVEAHAAGETIAERRGLGVMGRPAGWRAERERDEATGSGTPGGGDASERAVRPHERGGRVRPDGRRFGFAGHHVGGLTDEDPSEGEAEPGRPATVAEADAGGGAADDTVTEAAVLDPGASPSSKADGTRRVDVSGGSAGDHADALPANLAGADDAGTGDDLQRIRGVGPKNEERLKAAGVKRFVQIAEWTPEEARAMGEMLRFGGRIEREDWMSQARELAAGRDTEFSRRVDAGEVRSSLEPDDPRRLED